MTKLEQIKRVAMGACVNTDCSKCSLIELCDNREINTVAQTALQLLSYDSDLSKCRVGNLIWTTQSGWSRIKKVYKDAYYPIVVDKGGTYTLGGQFAISDIAPSAFITPPLCFNPGPKPESVCNCEAYKETSSANTINISKGTVLPDGGIVACQYGGYWLVVAPATRRELGVKFGLYNIDTQLADITDTVVSDPQDGKHNTDMLTSSKYNKINDSYGSIGAPAAEFCRALSADYFLPNKEELIAIQAVASDIDAVDTSGGTNTFSAMGTNWIWTSTEYNSNNSWIVRASDGDVSFTNRGSACWVVPVRRIAI